MNKSKTRKSKTRKSKTRKSKTRKSKKKPSNINGLNTILGIASTIIAYKLYNNYTKKPDILPDLLPGALQVPKELEKLHLDIISDCENFIEKNKKEVKEIDEGVLGKDTIDKMNNKVEKLLEIRKIYRTSYLSDSNNDKKNILIKISNAIYSCELSADSQPHEIIYTMNNIDKSKDNKIYIELFTKFINENVGLVENIFLVNIEMDKKTFHEIIEKIELYGDKQIYNKNKIEHLKNKYL